MKIIFHFGPPKSGTSALQKWLSANNGWLADKGVYYPDHSVDINGVSSGNLRKVFVEQDKELKLSQAMLSNEIEKAEKSQCHTIVFSSEFFFRNITEIAKEVPEAVFIGYVRFGLEVLQSSYNQAVKRHGKTTPFVPGRHVQSTLSTLSRKIDVVGEQHFILRPYSKALFVNNSLIADFLEAIGIDSNKIDTSVGRVNSSYCLKSIEVKRWFNQLQSESLQVPLDLALQGYGDTEAFSLFSQQAFERSKQTYLTQLKRFIAKHNVLKGQAFIAECEASQNKPYQEQFLSDADFEEVLRTLIAQKRLSVYTLYAAYLTAVEKRLELEQPQRVDILAATVPGWVKLIAGFKSRLMAWRTQENGSR